MESGATPHRVRQITEIDVRGVAEALGDHDEFSSWWYDPSNGQVEPGISTLLRDEYGDDDYDDPAERGLVAIHSSGSRPAYLDMVNFAAAIAEPRAADLLQRALEGRGAFRRFRDTLLEFPDLRQQWFDYSQSCDELRAIEWLLEEGYVDPHDAKSATAAREGVATAVLAAIGHRSGLDVEVGEVNERWQDIERAIDAGHAVTLLRAGTAWALITPP